MPGSGLSAAVDCGDLRGAELREGVPEQHPRQTGRRREGVTAWSLTGDVYNKTLLTLNMELMSFSKLFQIMLRRKIMNMIQFPSSLK